MSYLKNKTFYLFIVLFVHFSLLDLFFVTHKGPVFLIDKNLEIKTILTHLAIVCISVGFYVVLNSSVSYFRDDDSKVSDFTWVLWSALMIFAIGFILI